MNVSDSNNHEQE